MSTVKPPTSFWVIAGVALLWNLMGCFAYYSDATMTAEALAALPDGQRALYENVPAWVTAAFAIAVWFGLAGCILLLVRKKWAVPVFIISLIGAVVQNFHTFFMTNTAEVMGAGLTYTLPLLVIGIAIYLIMYSRKAEARGWIG